MSDDQRVYSDEEFALILRKATELASQAVPPGPASVGLTLTEMKAVAAQVGIDPALVERAARLLRANASSSRFERLIGGPLLHRSEVHFPVRLDEAKAAQLLSAVQIRAGQSGSGHASSIGMVWHGRDEMEVLSVTAQAEEGGTSIAVHNDRSTLAIISVVATLIGSLAATTAGLVLEQEVGPALGVAAGASGMGGILALARSYWASSTKQVRERISGLMDAVGQVIAESERPPSASRATGDDSGTPEIEV